MKSGTELYERFTEIFIEGEWVVSTNYKKQLQDLTWDEANTKITGLNTIAVLTYHIDYYVAGVLEVLKGGNLEISDKYSFDFPKYDSAEKWYNIRKKLFNDAEEFAGILKTFPEEKLDKIFTDEKYGDYRKNINALIEHAYYHLGQISLIKKMIRVKK